MPDLKRSALTVLRRAGLVVGRAQTADPWHAISTRVSAAAPVVLDIGANVGQTARHCAILMPAATIYSFEPSPATFRHLKAACGSFPAIHPVQAAMGQAAGSMPLYENENSGMSSLLLPGPAAWGSVERRDAVPVLTVDEFCADHAIDHLDVLKTDTQGYDLAVLKGAEAMLTSGRVDLLLTEVIFAEMYEGMPRFDAVLSHILDTGFRLVGFYGTCYQEGRASWADALFVAADSAPRRLRRC